MIMQPVADIDLHCYLSRHDLTFQDLVTLRSFVGCLCSALAYLHHNQCRHKDLKPRNILISEFLILTYDYFQPTDSTSLLPEGDIVLIADFGTAVDWTALDSDITVGQPEAVTKLYVAPEVIT